MDGMGFWNGVRGARDNMPINYIANQTCLVNNTPVLDRTSGHLSGFWNSVSTR